MKKALKILALLSSAVFVCSFVHPGEVTIESFSSEISKIASGVAAKKGENLDFCYISANFFQKRQNCGCFVYSKLFVVTSARCVFDCSEKEAQNVTVTFPQKKGKDAVRKVRKIILPDGENGEAAIETYDATKEVPFNEFSENNVAMLLLETPVTLDGVTARSFEVVGEDSVSELLERASQAEYKYRACGIGATDNFGKLPKVVQCTDVNLVANDKCVNPHDVAMTYTVPESFACIQWTSMENNLCAGDFGGPIYIYQLDPKGAAINQEVFCVAVGSPDIRHPASGCLDGHTTYCQFMTDAVYEWINNIEDGNVIEGSSKRLNNKKH